MVVINNENTEFFDVDDTLVLHEDPDTIPLNDRVSVTTAFGEIIVRPHAAMITLLKEAHIRGFCVIVWSKGGYNWASQVIAALGLEGYVNFVMSKPQHYFDDKPIQEWLTERIYLKPDTIYKPTTKEK